MWWASTVYWFAVWVVFSLLTACASLPSSSPFPTLDSTEPTEKARVIQFRTTGVHTLAAILTVTFAGPERQGIFEMIVNYDASGNMRFTAFRDLILSTRPIFDLVFVAGTYYLEVRNDIGGRIRQGMVSQFSQDHPEFRAFWVVGEAFFLPGFDGYGQPPIIKDSRPLQFTTRLKSGAVAHWVAKPETLEITKARIDDNCGQEAVSLLLEYSNYRKIGAYYIPGRVTLTDPSLGVVTRALVKQVDINIPLAPGVFEISGSATEPNQVYGASAFLSPPLRVSLAPLAPGMLRIHDRTMFTHDW